MSPEELTAVARVIRLGKLCRRYDERASWTGNYKYSEGVRQDANRLYREAEAHLVEMLPNIAPLLVPMED